MAGCMFYLFLILTYLSNVHSLNWDCEVHKLVKVYLSAL